MRQLIIEESKWYRGKGGVQSRLLRVEDGKMCCLGFDALACGLKEGNILDAAFPTSVQYSYPTSKYVAAPLPTEMQWLEGSTDDFADEEGEYKSYEAAIGDINDDDTISDDERKERLRPLFAVGGVELVFVP
jgi:hypothetical protein